MKDLEDDGKRILSELRRHFSEGGEALHPEDVAQLTGIGEPSVRRSLQELYRAHLLEGATVDETDEPAVITGIR